MNLKEIYTKQQYQPGVLGVFINPFYFARKGVAEAMALLAPRINGKTLDVGCGDKPYMHLCNSTEYIGLEMGTPDSRKRKKPIFTMMD